MYFCMCMYVYMYALYIDTVCVNMYAYLYEQAYFKTIYFRGDIVCLMNVCVYFYITIKSYFTMSCRVGTQRNMLFPVVFMLNKLFELN